MLTDDRKRQLDRLLDGDLADEQRAEVQDYLASDHAAITWYTERVMMHAQLRRAMQRRGMEAQTQVVATAPVRSSPRSRGFTKRRVMVTAAALVAMLMLFLQPWRPTRSGFATLEQTRAALWESGDLPTADGSRLGQGTLRLAEGLAIVQFDSGAEVILEAPASLTLVDEMNCRLTRGTAVSDIPESAQGFRISTPSADVVDYGTRFAVSVYEETGETHTQVMQGRVQVEYAGSDEVVELKTGQRNTVIGEVLGQATDGAEREHRTRPVVSGDDGLDWMPLEPVRDAYTGRVKGHESDVLLYVKTGGPQRTAYLGYDLADVDRQNIAEAELLLHFAPTGWGLASHVPDATFSVHGLVGDVPAWDESILHGEFPGEPDSVHLGSFTIPQGVQKGRFRVRSQALRDFLRRHPVSEITLRVIRDTEEIENGGLVHGFASRRHSELPAPTLSIRKAARD